MTRIVSGSYGGRTLQVPDKGTRPTSERVREAIFSWLDHRGLLEDAVVVDLFAGSGALGLEALSRGAVHATFVEANRRAADVIRRNVATLGADGAQLAVEKAERFVARPAPTAWTTVFVDPPYDLAEAELAQVLAGASQSTDMDGVLVVERSTRSPEPTWPEGWQLSARKDYGETAVYYVEWAGAGS